MGLIRAPLWMASITFSVPWPSASGARYLTIAALRNRASGSSRKVYGWRWPVAMLQASSLRK